ncbi:major facilitator superfamily domain-containing protein [Nemania abortiva]|nr:major facilitator superfamily domain-containing protein [Nemania abortiva]
MASTILVQPPPALGEAISLSDCPRGTSRSGAPLTPLNTAHEPHPTSSGPEIYCAASGDDRTTSSTLLTERIPDGGYGWVVVFACFVETFWVNAWSGSWGILQSALLQSTLRNVPPSTVSFVGSLGIALTVGLSLVCARLTSSVGARWTTLLGVLLYGAGNILSAFTVGNVGGLFVAAGVSYGVGGGLMYTVSTNLPVQWFSNRLGTANGLVKLGGGIGATVMAIACESLNRRLGTAWTFRIIGLMAVATGVPAALLIRERAPFQNVNNKKIQWDLFKNGAFLGLFLAGTVGTFALFVPSFFLPLVGSSIGLSSTVTAGIVAAFNASMAIGRLGSGVACDYLGPTNMLLVTMALNGISMLAIWSVSSTAAPLGVFAVLNGISNGSFYVTMPTAIGKMIGPAGAAAAMGLAITGWTPGYLLGSPIAGFLIAATGADEARSISPYRAAIFYAGGTAIAATLLVLIARLRMDTKLIKKL